MMSAQRPARVSVIINFENAAPFLREAIASVYAQTFADWELILVDDGSSDGSAGLARAAVDRDPDRVRCVQHPGGANRGMSASRNLGASESAGEYLAWLDADDVWFPRKLEQQVAILDAHPRAALVYGRTQHWYSWTGEPGDRDRDYVSYLGVEPHTLVEPPMLLTLALESRAPTPGPGEFLVRRTSFERAGGFEAEWRSLFEDQVFLAKLYVNEPVFVSDEPWIRYRRHERSATRMAGVDGRRAFGVLYLDWLERYLRESAVRDERLWRALRRKRRRYRYPRAYGLVKRLRTRSRRPLEVRMFASTLRKRPSAEDREMLEATTSGVPRVSVIVIFLNAERFFEEAIESIIDQDYTDWELLLVDDGSTDGSAEMARRYAERDQKRIRYLTHPNHENRGMSASRNLGIREARGEYVAFLDADDTWLPGKLSRQVAILDSYPTAAMVYGPTLRWYSWDGETPDEPRQFPLEVERVIDPPHLVRWLLQRQAAPAIGSVLARRDAVSMVGGFENEFRDLYEDQVFHFKMFLRHPVYVSSECWDRYRKHRDSFCVAAPKHAHDLARRRFLVYARRHLIRSRCHDPEIWRLLQRELRGLPEDPHAPATPALERLVAGAMHIASFPRVTRARAEVGTAGRAALTELRVHRRVTPRALERARRNGTVTLLRIPTSLVTDEYAFSLAPGGWHYVRALLAEYEQNPDVEPPETSYFRFFCHERLRSVRYLDDVLFLHRDGEAADDDFRFFFGTYPWGDWTESDARVGGKPFGHHFDAVEGADTRDLYGYRRNPWYHPGDDYPLRIEFRRTVELYRSLRKGYRPSAYGSLPSVVLLVRLDGSLRAVRYRGHHRLATLAHLGHDPTTVALDPESVKIVHESEVEQWYYVRHGLCPPERALEIFRAFFELDGSERREFLGLPHSY